MSDTTDRARGVLLGLAIGDALGTTVEFQPRGTFDLVTDIVGGGPFNLPIGAWTDDTNYDATESQGVPDFRNNQFLPRHTIGQRAFWLHNLRLAYRTPNGTVEVAGWVRNLEDKAYKTFAFDGSSFLNTTIQFVGLPRTYGLSVTTTF